MGFGVQTLAFSNSPQVPGSNQNFDLTPYVTPGSRPIQLGAIIFSSEECPEQLPIGAGEQMLIVHNMPGGGIIDNDFGNKPTPITWTGKFFGPNIGPRVKQLQEYRIAGQPLPLTYGDEQYTVRIKAFDPGYRGGYNEYSITLEVVAALNGAFNVPNVASLDQQVGNLMALATSSYTNVLAIDAKADVMQTALANLQAELALAIPLAATLASGGADVQNAAIELLTAAQTYESSIGGGFLPQTPDLTVLLASATSLLGVLNTGQVTGSLPMYGGELFSVAAMQYGDMSQAFTLANANGRVYPLLDPGLRTKINVVPVQSILKPV